MKLRSLSIRNFRGIQRLDWTIPTEGLVCLIGRGDTTKSTVLEAIRRLFHPYWSLSFADADCFGCDPKNQISIEGVLGDIPDSFHDLAAYGYRISGWDAENKVWTEDPGDGIETALRVRLRVSEDHEPTWTVIKGESDEGATFKSHDRLKVAVSMVGISADRHLTWSRGTILSKLTADVDIASPLAEAARAAKHSLDVRRADCLGGFDKVAAAAEEAARQLGVVVASSYKAHLDLDAVNISSGGLALHDDNMPLRQLGLGSRRLLTTALQQKGTQAGHITLFDELEAGLEPHRIARLIHYLRGDTTGQYFVTTHSPVALRELDISNLHVVHAKNGTTEIIAANKPLISDSLQAKVRTGAEAFLAPKMVICEGATEVGFLKGLDHYYWGPRGDNSFAYQGIALYDAGGANRIRNAASHIKQLKYDVAVLADSDDDENFGETDVLSLRALGVEVVVWGGGKVSIEERVFRDLKWSGVLKAIEIALESISPYDLLTQLQARYAADGQFISDIQQWRDEKHLREALGRAAKDCDWFKTQSKGGRLAQVTIETLADESFRDTELVKGVLVMRQWADRD